MDLLIGAAAAAATPPGNLRLASSLMQAGSFADICTFAVGLAFGFVGMLIRWRFRPGRDHYIKGFMTDTLQGVAFFPFLLLAFSLFSGRVLEVLLETNRVLLAVGGLLGALYVLGEFVRLAEREAREAGVPKPPC